MREPRDLAVGVLAAALVVGAAAPGMAAGGERWIDLSHDFHEGTLHWPTAQGFTHEIVHRGPTPAGFWYESNNFSSSEHVGTHMDAPAHFARGAWRVHEVPLDVLMGPVAVIDVSAACALEPDYRLSVDDIRRWEARHGRLARGDIVLMRTGWGARYSRRKDYFGSDVPGDASDLHFPGYSPRAAVFLARIRRIAMVGLDTPSLDHGPSRDFRAHIIFGRANVPGLENVANLDRLPARGATLIALPMKIRDGSGGPVRIIARLP